jgi:hypothetical protein
MCCKWTAVQCSFAACDCLRNAHWLHAWSDELERQASTGFPFRVDADDLAPALPIIAFGLAWSRLFLWFAMQKAQAHHTTASH